MATREIRWTIRAIQNKLSIFEFWTNRNKSTLYAEKMEKLFNEIVKISAIYPLTGIKTDISNVKIQIVRDFKIVYRIKEKYIEKLNVWDTRQNPKNFEF